MDHSGQSGQPAGSSLRERNAARLRAEILDAAASLFTDRGYSAVTVDDVAAAVGVATRTVYRHFPSKDDLVLAPLRAPLQRATEALRRAPDDEAPISFLRRLISTAGALVAPTEAERKLGNILVRDEQLRARHAADSAGMEIALMHYLKRASEHDSHPLSDIEARIRAAAAVGALRAAQRTAMAGDDGTEAFHAALDTAAAILANPGKSTTPDTRDPDD